MFHPISLPLQQGLRFFIASRSRPPTACLTVSLPERAKDLRCHVPHFYLSGQLRRNLDAGQNSGSVQKRYYPATFPTCTNTRKCIIDLIIPVGLCSVTTRKVLCLLSPYCPILALNRVGFPEGFPSHDFNPIRYIVRRASHPVISATAARLLRIPTGTCRVISTGYNILLSHIKTRYRVAITV